MQINCRINISYKSKVKILFKKKTKNYFFKEKGLDILYVMFKFPLIKKFVSQLYVTVRNLINFILKKTRKINQNIIR